MSETAGQEHVTVSGVFAKRLREVRKRRGLSARALAELVEALGYSMSRATLAKIETGGTRAENVSIADVLVICAALNVSPLYMILPDEEGPDAPLFEIAPNVALPVEAMRPWMRGTEPLSGIGAADGDERDFYREVPTRELRKWAAAGERQAQQEPGPPLPSARVKRALWYARDLEREDAGDAH